MTAQRRDLVFEFLTESPLGLADLAEDQLEFVERHARSCADCCWLVDRYVEEIAERAAPAESAPPRVTDADVRRVMRLLRQHDVPGARRAPLLSLLAGTTRLPLRPVAAAALLVVVFLGGAAVAVTLQRTAAIPGTIDGMRSVASFVAQGYDFEPVGMSTTSTVEGELDYVLPDGMTGRLLAVAAARRKELDLVSFGPDRVARWRGSALWRDPPPWGWGGDAAFRAMRIVRTFARGGGRELVERAAVFSGTPSDMVLTVLDPERGSIDFQFRYPGVLVVPASAASLPQVLPEEPGAGRPLLVGGSFGHELSAVPVLICLAPDGNCRQEIRLPLVRPGVAFDVHVTIVRVDFRSDPATVTAHTSEGAIFEFDVRSGRLDAAHVAVRPTDNLFARIRREVGEREYAEFLSREGGAAGLLERLRRGVVDLPPAEFRGTSRR